MRIFSDLHIHSKYARATSKDMDLEHLSKYGKIKGLNLIGTGDFTYPAWLKELKEKLKPIEGSGLYVFNDMNFMLTTEISTVYFQDGKTRKIHHIIHVPDFETVDQINEELKRMGGNLGVDGRLLLNKVSSPDVVEKIISVSKDSLIVPAHAWTPWFSVFGDKSGFDSIEDCYQDQTKHIYAIETGLSCYDEKTEVLTDSGWKKFPEVTYSDKICTLNLGTDEIEFQDPLRTFSYKYRGKMYRLKTKRVDLLVTSNHKLLVGHCDFRKPLTFSLKEARFLFNKSKRFKKNGSWTGKNIKYFTLPTVKIRHGSRYYSGFRNKKEKLLPIKPWLKFFGFWLAEGWTTQGKNGHYAICVANRDKDLLIEMKKILESFGYNVYYDDKINYTIRIRDYQLSHYLKQFGKCSDKFIPSDIKFLSKGLLEILFKYYIKGDGHIYGRNGKGLSATTTSIRLRDDLQEIALKLGISAYYKLGQKKGAPFLSPSQGKIYKQRNDTWIVYFIRKNIHTVLPSTIKKYNYIESWIDFKGNVFCVAVPNQIIYIRRNGIPVWCGNSDPAMNWRLSRLDKFCLMSNSDSHSPWPWRLGREFNAFELKKLTYLELFDAVRKKDKKRFLFTGEVDPAYGKYHWTGHRNCKIRLSPKQALKINNICPVCKRKLTIGVEQRVEQLADKPEGFIPKDAIPYKNLIPLSELIKTVFKINTLYSKTIWAEFNKLVKRFGNELNVLLGTSREELEKVTNKKLTDMIMLNREGKIKIIPGYDGVYGQPVFEKERYENFEKQQKSIKIPTQKTLSDFGKGL